MFEGGVQNLTYVTLRAWVPEAGELRDKSFTRRLP